MKAIVYSRGELQVREVDRPTVGPGEVLIKVKAAAICGTDLRILKHGHHHIGPDQERILGHEVAGVIEEAGPGVEGLTPGLPVAVAPNIHCCACDQCVGGATHLCRNNQALGINLDGGFAEYMHLPAQAVRQGNIIPLAEGVDFGQAALNEPLACCFNSLEYTELSLGETILIIGAGPIGVMHTLLANRMGAAQVILADISDARLVEGGRFGADLTFNPAETAPKKAVMEATSGRGVDVAVVACPVASAQNQALECLAPHGRMNFFGGLPKDSPLTTLNANLIHYNYLKVVGTTRQSLAQYRKTLSLIQAGKLDLRGLISNRFALDRAEDAFGAAQSGEGLKTIFEM